MPTLLGFDYGTRKIGVAVGQTVSATATPLTTVRNLGQKPDWKRIESIIRDWKPDAAVLGLPFRMDDSEEDWTNQVRRFARQLEGRFGLTVHLIDERLTTIEAERDLAAADRAGAPVTAHQGGRGRRGTDDPVDAYAAKLILEIWLNDQH
ncbi:MAG: Holliday junction resolvase RuvX [Thiohalocapsa sp.]